MQFHNYIFLTSTLSFRDLPKSTKTLYKNQFAKLIQSDKRVVCNAYSTLGLKAQTNILLWLQADSIEDIQQCLNMLIQSHLGRYLTITYTLFGMTRPTQYSPHSTSHLDTNRKGGKYLIIYPFTKTQAWYQLDSNTRKELMKGHITIGKNFPHITQLLLYSYGIDDYEFIVSYETDDLISFQSLVMDLRFDKVRDYTLKDTPIFTAIYQDIPNVLNYL